MIWAPDSRRIIRSIDSILYLLLFMFFNVFVKWKLLPNALSNALHHSTIEHETFSVWIWSVNIWVASILQGIFHKRQKILAYNKLPVYGVWTSGICPMSIWEYGSCAFWVTCHMRNLFCCMRSYMFQRSYLVITLANFRQRDLNHILAKDMWLWWRR